MNIKKYEWAAIGFTSLILGILATAAGLRMTDMFFAAPESLPVSESSEERIKQVIDSVDSSPTGPNDVDGIVSENYNEPNGQEEQQAVINEGQPRGEDIPDVLLIYNSQMPTDFDINFCEVAKFYGLLCQKADLSTTNLTDERLRDRQGNFYKLIGVSGPILTPEYMSQNELLTITEAVEREGTNLIVSKVNDTQSHEYLTQVTNNMISGVRKPIDDYPDWIISSEAPEITREFTGQAVHIDKDSGQNDYALTIADSTNVVSLIESTDVAGRLYSLFAMLDLGQGKVFIDSGQSGKSLLDYPLTNAYYDQANFSLVIPLMFSMRYSLQDEVWHQERNLANFTIDDPPLWADIDNHELLKFLNYQNLLLEMEAHNFHTTIAMPPHFWNSSEPEIVRLFVMHPDRFSLVQHGNNHDGFEFFRYEAHHDDKWPSRPLAEQEVDIVEGRARLNQHEYLTGIPFGQIMVFPYATAPVPTFELLKKYNYLSVIHTAPYPLDAEPSPRMDYSMQPASLDYASFPLVHRREIPAWDEFFDSLYPVYEFFIDKPAFIDSHVISIFVDGMDGFSYIADEINEIEGDVEWKSPDYILKRLYREKLNDDGSLDVEMYTRHLILENSQDDMATYHISKEEAMNVPIVSLTVNGREFPYLVEDGYLKLNMEIPSHEEVVIIITYDETS